MGIEENKAAIGRFLSQRVFFEGDLAVVDDVFSPDVVFRSPGNGEEALRGTDAIDAIKNELRIYDREEGRIAILEQIAEGELVATRYRLELPWAKYVGVTLSRFADGKIQEYRVVVTDDEDIYRAAGKGHN